MELKPIQFNSIQFNSIVKYLNKSFLLLYNSEDKHKPSLVDRRQMQSSPFSQPISPLLSNQTLNFTKSKHQEAEKEFKPFHPSEDSRVKKKKKKIHVHVLYRHLVLEERYFLQ